MSDTVFDLNEERRKATETLVRSRTNMEVKFERWKQSILGFSQELRDKIPFDYVNMDIRTEVPEWYVPYPKQEIASAQVAALNEKREIVNQLLGERHAEGVEQLLEFNRLYNSGN